MQGWIQCSDPWLTWRKSDLFLCIGRHESRRTKLSCRIKTKNRIVSINTIWLSWRVSNRCMPSSSFIAGSGSQKIWSEERQRAIQHTRSIMLMQVEPSSSKRRASSMVTERTVEQVRFWWSVACFERADKRRWEVQASMSNAETWVHRSPAPSWQACKWLVSKR